MAEILGTRRETRKTAAVAKLADYAIPKKKIKVEDDPTPEVEEKVELKQSPKINSPNGKPAASQEPKFEEKKYLNSFDDDQENELKDKEDNPWWKPTADDNSDEYTLWYKNTYQAALKAEQNKGKPVPPKPKKPKEEPIVVDASTEAAKVAEAQKELTSLMKPLSCDLCTAKMNSNHQSKMHYEGKAHQRKVVLFLTERKKQLLVEMVKPDASASKDTEDKNKHCPICRAWFTSAVMAESHYAGKKHKRAAYGIAIGKKSKNVDGSDIKMPTDESGRFGIGHNFVKGKDQPLNSSVESSAESPSPKKAAAAKTEDGQYRCDICDVITNRADQLEIHLGGSKHQKKLKSLQAANSVGSDNIIIEPTLKDYSEFKTASGQYYCTFCDQTLEKEVLFIQHVNTKNHKFAVSLKNRVAERESKE